MGTALEPLTCRACGAPVPLGEGDEVVCPSCSERQPLTEAYRQFRDARRLSAEAARALDTLCADISRPTPGWKRGAVVVGFTVGTITLVILAIGALVGVVVGFLAAAKADAGDTIGGIIVVICGTACGLISVPFVGELVVVAWQHGDFDMGYALATGMNPQWNIDIGVGAVLYLFSIVPIALALRTKEGLRAVEELRRKLAAVPAVKGGALGCRRCGAPLDVAAGALAARCLYCATDNLVSVSSQVAARAESSARDVHEGLKEALAAHVATQKSDRATMWAMIVLGPLLAPLICLGGSLLHNIVS